MLDSLKNRLSILNARYFTDGYAGKKEYSYGGLEEELYLFSGQVPAGMTTPWGDILINERLFRDGNENVLDYVFTHEKGHQSENFLWFLVHGAPRFLVSPLMLLLHGIIAITALATVVNGTGNEILAPSTAHLALTLQVAAIVSTSLLAKTAETLVDFYAINVIGLENFIEASKEYSQVFPDRQPHERLSMWLTHPSYRTVARLYELKEKLSRS